MFIILPEIKHLKFWYISYFNCLSFSKVSHAFFRAIMVSKTSLISSYICIRRPLHFPWLNWTEEWKHQEWEERKTRAHHLLFSYELITVKELNGPFKVTPSWFCSHDLFIAWFFSFITKVQLLIPLLKLAQFFLSCIG